MAKFKTFLILALLATALFPQIQKEFKLVIAGEGDLSGYTILLGNSDAFFVTDKDGRVYSPADDQNSAIMLPYGTNELEIIYKSRKITRTVVIDESTPETITIEVAELESTEEDVKKLNEILITDGGDSMDSSRKVLSADEARLIPGTGGDILLSMQNFPGVISGARWSQGLFIRGGDRWDILFNYDGIKMGDPFHDLGFYSVFPSAALENIEFFPSAFPSQFGPSQGAVVNIIPKKTFETDHVHGDIDANIAAAGFYFTIPFGDRWSLQFGGRRTYYGFYLKLMRKVSPSFTQDFDIFPFFWDYNIKLDWLINDRHHLKLTALGSNDKLEFDSDNVTVTNQYDEGSNTYTISATLNDMWHAQGLIYNYDDDRLKVKSTVYNYLYTNSESLLFLGQTWLYNNFALVNDFIFDFSEKFQFNTGMEYTFQTFTRQTKDFPFGTDLFDPNMDATNAIEEFLNSSNLILEKDFKPRRHVIHAWAEPRFKWNIFRASIGGRLMFNSANKKIAFDPRASFIINPIEELEIFFKTGLYTGLVGIARVDKKYGEPDLKNPFAIHYSLGTDVILGKYKIKLEGYYKDMRRQDRSNPFYRDGDYTVEPNPRYLDNGRGRAYGLEIMTRREVRDGIFGWLSYTWSRSERYVYTNDITYEELTNISDTRTYRDLNQAWRIFRNDTPHMLTFIGSWEVIKTKFKISTRFSLSSGQPYTPMKVDYLDLNGSGSYEKPSAAVIAAGGTNDLLIIKEAEQKYSRRLPVKYYWDLSLYYTWHIRNKVDLTLYIEFWNIQHFWHKNAWGYNYDLQVLKDTENIFPGQEVPKSARKQINDLPFIPLIGFTLKF